MLLHLPIAIMAALSPIAVSDSVPQFDIVKECRFEGGSMATLDRCSQDKAAALSELKSNWAKFAIVDQKTCMAATTNGGFVSYVELLTCLEMARDAVSASNNPQDPRTKSGSGSTRPARTGVNRRRCASTLRRRFQERVGECGALIRL
jgi:hypothetical protein